MLTQEERIRRMHGRARLLERRHDQSRLVWSACLSTVLLACLVGSAAHYSALPVEAGPAQYAGSSLLDDSTGGYALVAVLAFIAGVALTVALRKRVERRQEGERRHGR